MEVLLSLVFSFVVFGVTIMSIVHVVERWEEHHAYFRRAVVVALLAVSLSVPDVVATMAYFDPTPLLSGGGSELAKAFMTVWFKGVTLLALGFVFMQVAAGITASETLRDPASAYPWLFKRPEWSKGVALSALVGTVGGAATVVGMKLLDIGPGSLIILLEKSRPGFAQLDVLWQLVIVLATLIGAAVAEEVLFRGLIQQWLSRKLVAWRFGVAIAIVLTSLLWAMGHAGNTDAPLLKMTQIALLGLAFGWLARRYSVESSAVAHVMFNVVAVLGCIGQL